MIKIKGLNKLEAALADTVEAIEAGAKAGRRETAELIAEEWADDVPVDTGEYKRSIGSDDDGAFAVAEHASDVEFGTSTRPGRASAAAAAAVGRKRMPEIVADAIRRELS